MSLDDLNTTSILLHKYNNLTEEITQLLNKVRIFAFKFEKHPTGNQALNIFKTCTVKRDNFEQFKMFSSIATACLGLEPQFS